MKEKDCWEKFIISGKVEDYLEYRNSVEDRAHNKADTVDMGDSIERNSYAYRDDSSFISS